MSTCERCGWCTCSPEDGTRCSAECPIGDQALASEREKVARLEARLRDIEQQRDYHAERCDDHRKWADDVERDLEQEREKVARLERELAAAQRKNVNERIEALARGDGLPYGEWERQAHAVIAQERAAAAALREALLHLAEYGYEHPDHHDDDCPGDECEYAEDHKTAAMMNRAMSPDAGREFLERLRRAEEVGRAAHELWETTDTKLRRLEEWGRQARVAMESFRGYNVIAKALADCPEDLKP